MIRKVAEYEKNFDFYNSITKGKNKWIIEELKKQRISILTGFVNNNDLVKDFYELYYSKNSRRIVLCGINSGRLGAGKTGVPFLDFKSLSQLLPNISWFGFIKNNKNFNYYYMTKDLQREFTNGFIEEMDIVQPSVIVPLSEKVEKSLKKIKNDGEDKYE